MTLTDLIRYLVAMNNRLELLEAKVNSERGNYHEIIPDVSPSSGTNDRRQVQFESADAEEWIGESVSVNRDHSQDSADLQDSNDGMEAIVFTDEENCGYFGGCSLDEGYLFY